MLIEMTGAWNFGVSSGIAAPETTVKLDLFSDGARDYYRGLFGLSADDGNPSLPMEPDGGIGDGAGPIPTGDPLPVEPDGGIGDGAGPPPEGDTEDTDGTEGPDGDGTIMPVEPDGGIGDGAGPPPEAEGDAESTDGEVTILPVEPDGGIGDGAGPPPELEPGEGVTIDGGGEGTKADDVFIASDKADTFVFLEGHGDDTIIGFDLAEDRLDFTDTEIDFTDLESLLAHATDQMDTVDASFVIGVYIETGEGTGVFLDGISSADLSAAQIDF
ncbi:hypothetical protein [Kordiimonas lacus]|uniref:Uncharacterized protein n=1 Tax=Kordiimonas lacus TaxID=637679 RepID=A0A1G6XMH3_9PROT|nr:hypothetical protein [Kordiimonas lacus]SDD79429.1 hypothetical protein SAMN04488071_1293 [Kordiimonas lacus]